MIDQTTGGFAAARQEALTEVHALTPMPLRHAEALIGAAHAEDMDDARLVPVPRVYTELAKEHGIEVPDVYIEKLLDTRLGRPQTSLGVVIDPEALTQGCIHANIEHAGQIVIGTGDFGDETEVNFGSMAEDGGFEEIGSTDEIHEGIAATEVEIDPAPELSERRRRKELEEINTAVWQSILTMNALRDAASFEEEAEETFHDIKTDRDKKSFGRSIGVIAVHGLNIGADAANALPPTPQMILRMGAIIFGFGNMGYNFLSDKPTLDKVRAQLARIILDDFESQARELAEHHPVIRFEPIPEI